MHHSEAAGRTAGQLTHEFDEILRRTLDDRRVSRGERRALSALLDDAAVDGQALGALRHRAFEAAREAMHDPRDRSVLEWLEEMVKVLTPATHDSPAAEALFSPGTACRERLVGLFMAAARRVDVCVFTITDDHLSEALLDAHRRGVAVRILTDVVKAGDPGSDVDRFRRAGIRVAVDTSDKHMHHKFAIFDERKLVTGSYNWTRSAAVENEENIVVLEDAGALRAFAAEFERLWSVYA